MKKLLMLAVLLVGGLTVFASTNTAEAHGGYGGYRGGYGGYRGGYGGYRGGYSGYRGGYSGYRGYSYGYGSYYQPAPCYSGYCEPSCDYGYSGYDW